MVNRDKVIGRKDIIKYENLIVSQGEICDCIYGVNISQVHRDSMNAYLMYVYMRVFKINDRFIFKSYLSYFKDSDLEFYCLDGLKNIKYLINPDNKIMPECFEFYEEFMTISEYRNQKIDDILK